MNLIAETPTVTQKNVLTLKFTRRTMVRTEKQCIENLNVSAKYNI